MAKATINNEQISFCFSIAEISKLNGRVWSPEVSIQGVPWKILAYKSTSKAKPSLALFLYCAKTEAKLNWSHLASATFELTSFKKGCPANKFDTDPHVFDHSNRYYGIKKFIHWDELFDAKSSYVKDDTINLKIEIREESNNAKVTSFESVSKSCDDGCWSSFQVTVSNIESLTAAKTPEIVLRKIPAKFILFKHSNLLGIKLFFNSTCSGLSKVNFNTELTADLVSSNAGAKRSENVQGVIGRNKNSLRMNKLIFWDDLLEPKNGFIKDGAVTIDLEIKTELIQGGHVSNGRKRKATDNHQPAAKHLKFECKICKKEIIDQDISSLPCGHMFCSPCITKSIQVQKVCPTCNVQATQNGLRRILLPKSD